MFALRKRSVLCSRATSSGEWQYFLTDRDLVVINGLCEPFLQRFGYALEREPTAQTPSPAIGSGYVDRLISEARSLYSEGLRDE